MACGTLLPCVTGALKRLRAARCCQFEWVSCSRATISDLRTSSLLTCRMNEPPVETVSDVWQIPDSPGSLTGTRVTERPTDRDTQYSLVQYLRYYLVVSCVKCGLALHRRAQGSPGSEGEPP